jgi:hypothetical protein
LGKVKNVLLLFDVFLRISIASVIYSHALRWMTGAYQLDERSYLVMLPLVTFVVA